MQMRQLQRPSTRSAGVASVPTTRPVRRSRCLAKGNQQCEIAALVISHMRLPVGAPCAVGSESAHVDSCFLRWRWQQQLQHCITCVPKRDLSIIVLICGLLAVSAVAAPAKSPVTSGNVNDVGLKDAPLPSLFPPEPKAPAPVSSVSYSSLAAEPHGTGVCLVLPAVAAAKPLESPVTITIRRAMQ